MKFPCILLLSVILCGVAFGAEETKAAPVKADSVQQVSVKKDSIPQASAKSDTTETDSLAKYKESLKNKAANEYHVYKDDADQDGVADSLDKCPNTLSRTIVDTLGCPMDFDGDGVGDDVDRCPNTPKDFKVDSLGCPFDDDHDGTPNELDKCPGTPADVHQVDVNGCPRDADKDGVFDEFDKCPNTPQGTPVDERGCPRDSDGDGVFDVSDKCPDTPKGVMVNREGCPFDTDKDGVYDEKDECPNTPHGYAVDSVGCTIDDDRDGVINEKDKCPNTIFGVEVDSVGCPLNKKQDLDLLRKGINFKTGSAELTKNSTPTLDDIVALLKDFPDVNLEIQGHTDNKGKPAKNKVLSEDRAKSVLDYITSHGIDVSRLRSAGYGQERPVADNKTSKGRAKNRRVELIPFYNDAEGK